MITAIRVQEGKTFVTGVAHDNGTIAEVIVNGRPARLTVNNAGVVDWETVLEGSSLRVSAGAVDQAGNRETTPHEIETGTATAAAQ